MARKKVIYNIYVSKIFVEKQDQPSSPAEATKPTNNKKRVGKKPYTMMTQKLKEKEIDRLSLALEREEAECRRKRERIASLEREMSYDNGLELLESLGAAKQIGLLGDASGPEAPKKDEEEELKKSLGDQDVIVL